MLLPEAEIALYKAARRRVIVPIPIQEANTIKKRKAELKSRGEEAV